MSFKSLNINSLTQESIHQTILDLLKDENKGLLLEIGAYKGYLTQKIQNEGFKVMACDLNPQNFIPKEEITCQKVDLNKTLPYEDETFDYIVGAEVIEHIENPWHLIRELYRITKPNGIVILSTPNLHNWYVRLGFLLNSNLYNFVSSYEEIGHITPVFLWNLERMAKGRFKLTEIKTSRSFIPKLNILLPFKGLGFGQCVIVKMLREENFCEDPSLKWYS
ncbi:class I SAM-dependent methyltransferase [Gloeothece verrucosa]|uniref:Methyltransferase type 11 n=1 Tax=Gloeothece verrucosa (strain PCC 7822) TaxID=497965 RepID=E0UI43_GLOV7|nr:class I SAM-dependent methyltransferase [Gloeothece verrucosa]ADN15695.1 Methyltransferase type 11 [Gloeothece verrucosa PCC 7822]